MSTKVSNNVLSCWLVFFIFGDCPWWIFLSLSTLSLAKKTLKILAVWFYILCDFSGLKYIYRKNLDLIQYVNIFINCVFSFVFFHFGSVTFVFFHLCFSICGSFHLWIHSICGSIPFVYPFYLWIQSTW